MTDQWKPDPNGRKAAGVEFHGWLGFAAGSDLWHRYRVVGWVTFYRRRAPLVKFSEVMRATLDVMRGKGGER